MFSFQRSLPLVEAALLSYHSASFMSTTFFKLFPKLFVVVCCPSATFNNIPYPHIGWTVQTYKDGNRYRFDGKEWVLIDIFGRSIQPVSEHADGLMTVAEHVKLKSIPLEVKELYLRRASSLEPQNPYLQGALHRGRRAIDEALAGCYR
ncbi:hypothetical protein N2384_00435 [Bacillus paralicheniformis]|uniref:hypothetical protein n=1 Tax=Bacillus paralicheniformis TaxID=1648923 RepID=UPI0021A2E612|nr:hypothetical protein [Bacillus paralicheniformis]UWS61864.1 hypothetical protein N2384_00435 [Bacillus paralicheniformis]